MKRIYHANVNKKKTRESILTSDKMDFRNKKIKRKREGHYLLIKGLVHKVDIGILKCVCTKQQSYKSKNWITKRRNKSQLQLEILTILLQKLIEWLDRKSAISVDTEKAFDKM